MGKPATLSLIMLLLFILPGCARKHSQQVFSADNVAISYHVQGQGKPALVFVHGWCCDKRYWKFQVPYFSKQYKVVAIDLAGHGQSGLGRKDYTIEAFGGDVVAVVEKLDLDQVILIGHSLGGPVIIEAARQMPGRVIGCVGADTLHNIGKSYGEKAEKMIFNLKLDFVETMQNFVRGAFKADADPEVVEWVAGNMSSMNPEVGISVIEHISEYDLKEAVKDIQVPIVCINSDFQPTNVEANRKYARIYEVKLMPGIGHFVMMEDAETFNRLLAETIEIRIWERGAGYTLASGSSSCAAAAAACKLGLVDNKINVKMPGGNLLIEISENEEVYMTGPVEGVFEGCFHPDLKEKVLEIK